MVDYEKGIDLKNCKISNVRNLLDKNGEIDMSFKPSLEKQKPILKE